MERNSKPNGPKSIVAKTPSSPGLVIGFVVFLGSLAISAYYFFLRKPKPRPHSQTGPAVPLSKTGESQIEASQPIAVTSWLRIGLLFGTMILGVAGQVLLQTGKIPAGAACIGLAVLIFIILSFHQKGPADWLLAEPWDHRSFNLNWSALAKGGLIASVLLAALAFWLFDGKTPAIYSWLLHFLSIALLIFTSYRLANPKLSSGVSKDVQWSALEIGSFLLILLIAAFMRLYRFDQIPFGFWYDEADNGLSALNILNQPGYLPVFVQSTNLPAHFLYLIVFSFKILGASYLAVRAVSVIFGMATVAASFFLGNELFNRRMGLVTAFFFAISRWDVNWSRIGMHGVSVPFWATLSILLVLRAIRSRRLPDFTLAGFSLGLGLCFYSPLYFLPIVVAVVLLFLWLHRPRLLFSFWPGFLFLALGFLTVTVPISQFALRQTETFSGRWGVTSIFKDKTTQQAWTDVAKNAREHILMFNYRGDNNGRHNLPGRPMLDPVSGAFMVLGLGACLWRIRQPGSFLLIAWLLIMLLPGIFSLDFESPQSLRAIGTMPAVYLLAVIPIYFVWQEWRQAFGKRFQLVFTLPLLLSLGAAAALNYYTYFEVQAKSFDVWESFSTPETIIGNQLAKLGKNADIYVSIFYHNSPTVRFLAQNLTAEDYTQLQTYDTLPFLSDGTKPIVFFVDRDREPFFIQARHYYPNADFKEYQSPTGGTVLYQITLDPSDIQASQGVTVSYYRDNDWSGQPFLVTNEKTIDMDWVNGTPVSFPFWVKWQTSLFADRYGVYRLILHSPSSAELYLDDRQVPLVENGDGAQTAEVELAKGVHALVLKAEGQNGLFRLDWQPPDGDQALVSSSHLLLPPISNNGLLGKYFANGEWQDPPAYTQIDPWIKFNYHVQPLIRPYTVEWTGRIYIAEAGLYQFGIQSVDEAALYIDGVEVISALEPNGYKESEITLQPGFHQFRLRYADRTGYTHINLYWKPPNSAQEIVPQEVLFLP